MKVYAVYINEHNVYAEGAYGVYSSFDNAYMAILHYTNKKEEHIKSITNDYDMTAIETEDGFYIIEPFELDKPMIWN